MLRGSSGCHDVGKHPTTSNTQAAAGWQQKVWQNSGIGAPRKKDALPITSSSGEEASNSWRSPGECDRAGGSSLQAWQQHLFWKAHAMVPLRSK